MMYYIFGPGDDQTNISEDNELGSVDINKTFWPGSGFSALSTIINNVERYDNIIEHIMIFDDKKKSYTVEEFLDVLKKFKIKK